MKLSKKLNNRYFILRHGESKANVAGILLSHPEESVKEEYTLTSKGENQVRTSVKKIKREKALDDKTVICSSPFSRCKRTAEIAKEVLGIKNKIIFDNRLRERWFGIFEKQHNNNYQKVWDIDKENPEHKEFEVESAKEVQERTLSLIKDLEKKYTDNKILLVSHGDVLQILQTIFLNKSPSKNRETPHLETAEIKELKLNY